MKNRFRHLVTSTILLLLTLATTAQDTARFRQDKSPGGRADSANQQSDTSRPRRGGMSSLFADSAKLTSSDYQLQIEKPMSSLIILRTKANWAWLCST
ncbi:hypothetical protein [Paraflavitalea speifideaquila]|uniref:hypothetical protein n=1 Tax=Paraflavitalea speifideaquila TaxID=3076558 RepID=UPI0028F022F8|nr:hypothetical protein [Paraflavitalea speifideiaquila]